MKSAMPAACEVQSWIDRFNPEAWGATRPKSGPSFAAYVAGGGDPKHWRVVYQRDYQRRHPEQVRARKQAAAKRRFTNLLRLDKLTCE